MIKYLLAHPLTRGLDIDNPRCTQIRWSIIQKKPFLRQIYEEWYSAISALLLLPQEPVLELGSGGGFLSDYIPGLITSEVFYCQHVGVILDGSNLPFKNESLAAIVMTDVLHHLPEARGFLAEAERCVRSGGLVIMIEPWVTSWSRWVYSKLHHEPFRPDALEWSFPSKGPLSGANGALPWIIFARDRTQFEEEFPELHIQSIQPFMPFRYLLSGGVSLRSFMPGWSFALWRKGENLLKPWMKSLAMFALIVLRKDCIVASSGPVTGSDHEKELDDLAAGSQGE
jgi:SAM-dependent methyltransferase